MKPLPFKLPLKRWLQKINTLPQRDRMAMMAGGLALIIGLEFQVVMPIHDRRFALMATQHGLDPLQEQNDRNTLAQKQAQVTKLRQQLAQRLPLQSGTTQGGSPKEVFASLRKAMALQEVDVLTLKALPDEAAIKPPSKVDVVVPPPADGGSAPVEAAVPAAPAAAEPSVFRHRAELKIAGPLANINQVLQKFAQSNQLMRLERVALQPSAQDAKVVEATLQLVTISQEQSWLAM